MPDNNNNNTKYNSHNHQHKDKLCYHCNTLKDTVLKYRISDRGYGSMFDGDIFEIQLCPECAKKLKLNPIWFDNCKMGVKLASGCYEYLAENKIKELVDKLPTYNREYVINCENVLMPYIQIDRDDWIEENISGEI